MTDPPTLEGPHPDDDRPPRLLSADGHADGAILTGLIRPRSCVGLWGQAHVFRPQHPPIVEEKTALGVKVSAKDRRDVTLYFDKETGLLVKYESRVKDEGSGQEVSEENFATDYKDVQGTKQAGKFTVKRDGKLYLEGELTDHQLSEKLVAGVFAKP